MKKDKKNFDKESESKGNDNEKDEVDLGEITGCSDKRDLELEKIKKDLESYKDKFLRIAAEYENYRKRSEKEKLMIYSDATSNAVSKILPVADSLESASKSMEGATEEYKKGLNLVIGQFFGSLAKLNVKSFGAVGDEFNPDIHNAISHIKDESDKENFISQVFQKGYMIGDKVIRHAMVQVTN